MASRMDQMQSTIEALRVSLAEVTTEVVSLRTAANASAAAVASLTTASNVAWDGLTARADRGLGDGIARDEREWDRRTGDRSIRLNEANIIFSI